MAGWALVQLNPLLRGKRGLIQRSVDIWRDSNQDRVRPMAKMYHRNKAGSATPHPGKIPDPASAGVPAQATTTRHRRNPPGAVNLTAVAAEAMPMDFQGPSEGPEAHGTTLLCDPGHGSQPSQSQPVNNGMQGRHEVFPGSSYTKPPASQRGRPYSYLLPPELAPASGHCRGEMGDTKPSQTQPSWLCSQAAAASPAIWSAAHCLYCGLDFTKLDQEKRREHLERRHYFDSCKSAPRENIKVFRRHLVTVHCATIKTLQLESLCLWWERGSQHDAKEVRSSYES